MARSSRLKKIRLKQGTLAWEAARENCVGSSEVFDIVRYFATDTELQNCGLNAEAVRDEKPNTTAWALYHKMIKSGMYHKGALPPELAEYGHAMEPYGAAVLQNGRTLKLKRGEVYTQGRLIASLDISGVSEAIYERDFDYGNGRVVSGKSFVCEQKTVMPNVLKNGLPVKYVIQAQYQLTLTAKDFFILQVMTLDNDTVFERGKIVQLAKQGLKKLQAYLDGKVKVTHLYFTNNHQLSALIKICIKRFFDAVDNRKEPAPFLPCDKQKNIIESLRINSFYNKDKEIECNYLNDYVISKRRAESWEADRLEILQNIINEAMLNNASKFVSSDGYRASFSASGAFLIKPPKEDTDAEQNQII